MWLGRPLAESSWEAASSLPEYLVQDYENGIEHEIQEEVFTSGGHALHTISTKRCDGLTEPVQKKKHHIPSSVESTNKG